MYWLQSRYYDPEIGRFINADEHINDGFLGCNLFAYCVNNPINYIDPDGRAPIPTVVLYDPDDFSRQAKDEAKYLESVYGKKATLVAIRSQKQFTDAWNKYAAQGAAMSLIFHGSPKHLWVGENLMVDEIKGLKKANLYSLRILSCNGGHKDVKDNVANAFKSIGGIRNIYAMDGNLSFYPRNWYFFGYNYSKYGPRLSYSQNGFYKYASLVRVFAGPNVGYINQKRKPTGLYRV